MKDKGIEIITEAMAKNAEETENGVKVTYEAKGEEQTIEADYVLVTVGRRPNTDELGLEELGLKFGDRGLLEVTNKAVLLSTIFMQLVISFLVYHLLIKQAMKLK